MWVSPRKTITPARNYMWDRFGGIARAWSGVLSQVQRNGWNVAGPEVQSKTRLGSGPLSGQQLFQAINSARACIHLPLLWDVPAPVVFCANPVGQLILLNGENGVRLLLKVSGPVTEDIMVFGQAPCSAGRSKRRNVAYLGLLPAPQDGLSDITDLYKARYGEPRAGEKVFIVTRQQKNGWEGFDHETNEIVPGNPAGQQAAATGALTLMVHMYKGCTREVQGTLQPAIPCSQGGSKPGSPDGQAAPAAIGESGAVSRDSGGPGSDLQAP
jgi:hypothetical protein